MICDCYFGYISFLNCDRFLSFDVIFDMTRATYLCSMRVREREKSHVFEYCEYCESSEDSPASEEVEETWVENAFHRRYKVGTH